MAKNAQPASVNQTAIGDDNIQVVGSNNVITRITNFFAGDTEQQRAQRDRRAMLELVRNTWIKGVLEKSLYNEVRIQLGLEERPGAVEHPWDVQVQMPDQPNRTLLPGTSMIEVFDGMNGALLILGEPGSGKTTMLLELARDCIDRAKQDDNQPIPSVFNLSSWDGRQTLDDWLVKELHTKYNVPKKTAQNWVENDELQLLLDGLDEVRQENREVCGKAINEFRQRHGLTVPIAVCSRIADYEELKTKLNLSGAVYLQPLTLKQVDDYFKQAGRDLEGIYQILQKDETLQELVKQPLMLSIVTLAYRSKPTDVLASEQNISLETRRKHVFDTYVQQMFERVARTKNELYSPGQTKDWLNWLAQKMVQKTQTVFYIELLQADYLPKGFRYWEHAIVDRLSSGVLIGLLVWFLTFAPTDKIVWSLTGFIIAALSGQTANFDTVRQQSFWKSLGKPLIGGLIGVSIITPLYGYVYYWRLDPAPYYLGQVLLSIPIFGIMFVLFFRILGGPSVRPRRIAVVETLRWSWTNALRAGLGGLAIGSTCGLLIALSIASVEKTNPEELLQGLLFFMVAFGSLLALGLGVRAGLVGGEIPVKSNPNQGIWYSIRNSIKGGVILGGATFLFVMIIQAFWTSDFEFFSLITAVIGIYFNFVLWGSLIGMLIYGGSASLSHLILRYILLEIRAIPWNYVRFLDYCVDRIFLRRVGGGYIFVHRLLMEHFADMYPADEK